MSDEREQTEVLAFLGRPDAWPARPGRVEVIETHGALVFLAGDEVLKVKRAVKLDYLDFSTLEARRGFCVREIEINRPNAPEIYKGVVAITRQTDGSLAIGGSGEPVEWAVRMARFGQEQLLSRIVHERGIGPDLATALAEAVASAHARAAPAPGARDRIEEIASSIFSALAASSDPRIAQAAQRLRSRAEIEAVRSRSMRSARASAGRIRRCHGDLHLGNIVLWQGRPVPFDAIEFDEKLATIDTLYDLAFLLMDLERQGARAASNVVLNRYLFRTGDALDVQGLAGLPLYLGVRAAIRALVGLDRARLGADTGPDVAAHALETLALAERLLSPPPPRLVAVGGLSGTGKTTLAAALAPRFGAAPGALHLRTDLDRKWLAGVPDTERLPPSAYTPDAAARVYERIASRARDALHAGHCVVVDSVAAHPGERAAIEAVARDAGAPFTGLWLEAPAGVLKARVAARTGDASDATPAVVERQLGYRPGVIAWHRIDVSGGAEQALSVAARLLEQPRS